MAVKAQVDVMNTIGEIFRFTDFGESHGVAVGGVIDGVPSRLVIDEEAIRYDLDRRAGRIGELAVSERAKEEADTVEWLSGVIKVESQKSIDNSQQPNSEKQKTIDNSQQSGQSTKVESSEQLITLGTPVAFIIRNTDARSEDYEALKDVYR